MGGRMGGGGGGVMDKFWGVGAEEGGWDWDG